MKTNILSVTKNFLLLLLSISIFSSFTQAQDNPLMSKSNLKISIQYKLVQKHLLNNDNIQVDIKGNQIILSGNVPTMYDKEQAGVEAQSVDENYVVVNNLIVEGANVADAEISKQILKSIESNVFYGVYNWVSVNTNNGVVTLKGWVHLPWLKKQFQTDAEKVPGVISVKNEIQNTFGPGELGIRAARLIYNDPMFYGMQNFANPPIHIIVNNDTVILEGTVSSESQANWATNLVRYQTDAFSVENNLKVK